MKNIKKEFNILFQLDKLTIFDVKYYTLGSNKNPYFATSATVFIKSKRDFSRCGQCQSDVLYGEALEFYNKFDKYHLSDLTTEQYQEITEAIELLKDKYNFIEKIETSFMGFNFSTQVELSKMKLKTKKEVK